MTLLTLEQVEQMDESQCQQALKKLERTYKLDKSVQEYFTPELWDQLDDIVNTLLYLEDRIAYIQMVNRLNEARPQGK